MRAATAAALLFLLVGCATESPEALETPRCSTGKPAPVTSDALIRALRRHRFAAESDPSLCSMVEGDVAGVSNNESEDDDAAVLCSLGVAHGRPEATVSAVHYVNDDETHVQVMNVDCSLYPGPNEQKELHRLYAAFDDLVREAISHGDVSATDFGRVPKGASFRRCRPPDGRNGACSIRDEPLTFESTKKVCLRRTNVYRDGLLVREVEYEWYC